VDAITLGNETRRMSDFHPLKALAGKPPPAEGAT
jgi:hypothetical protein